MTEGEPETWAQAYSEERITNHTGVLGDVNWGNIDDFTERLTTSFADHNEEQNAYNELAEYSQGSKQTSYFFLPAVRSTALVVQVTSKSEKYSTKSWSACSRWKCIDATSKKYIIRTPPQNTTHSKRPLSNLMNSSKSSQAVNRAANANYVSIYTHINLPINLSVKTIATSWWSQRCYRNYFRRSGTTHGCGVANKKEKRRNTKRSKRIGLTKGSATTVASQATLSATVLTGRDER